MSIKQAINTSMFRLFISSTFQDFHEERTILQQKIFPRITQYCRKRRLSFQPIDLRWGLEEETHIYQKTLELCLEEVRACKSYPAPNFLFMLGDRYGWVPIPTLINTDEFNHLLKLADTMQQRKMLEWYVLDENQVPSAYFLKERFDEFLQPAIWSQQETELRTMFQNLVTKSSLSERCKSKYFCSATESEITEGVFCFSEQTSFQKFHQELKDNENVFGMIRYISKASQNGERFISNESEYKKAQKLKEDLICSIKTSSKDYSSQIFIANTFQETKESLNINYLAGFEKAVEEFIINRIDSQLTLNSSHSFTHESHIHKNYAKNKQQIFIGQSELLDNIRSYCLQEEQSEPMIVCGESGSGKSSIMAKSSMYFKESVIRFIGISQDSSNLESVLLSLLTELSIDTTAITKKQGERKQVYLAHDIKTTEVMEEVKKAILSLESINRRFIIFLDGLEQLTSEIRTDWLPSILPSNVKIILSVLRDIDYPEEHQWYKHLASKRWNQPILNIPKLSLVDASNLLGRMLLQENRKLQPSQLNVIEKKLNIISSPLYIQFLAQHVKHWSSNNDIDVVKNLLPINQLDIAEQYVKNLSEIYHFNKELVMRVVFYLSVSDFGFSENELLEILNADTELVEKLVSNSFDLQYDHGLPIVIWARLFQFIKPLLSIKRHGHIDRLSFYNREFKFAIKGILDYEDQKKEYFRLLTLIVNCLGTKVKLPKPQLDEGGFINLLEYEENIPNFSWIELFSQLIVSFFEKYRDEQQVKSLAFQMVKLNISWKSQIMLSIGNLSLQSDESRLTQILKKMFILQHPTDPEAWLFFYDREVKFNDIMYNLEILAEIKHHNDLHEWYLLNYVVFNQWLSYNRICKISNRKELICIFNELLEEVKDFFNIENENLHIYLSYLKLKQEYGLCGQVSEEFALHKELTATVTKLNKSSPEWKCEFDIIFSEYWDFVSLHVSELNLDSTSTLKSVRNQTNMLMKSYKNKTIPLYARYVPIKSFDLIGGYFDAAPQLTVNEDYYWHLDNLFRCSEIDNSYWLMDTLLSVISSEMQLIEYFHNPEKSIAETERSFIEERFSEIEYLNEDAKLLISKIDEIESLCSC